MYRVLIVGIGGFIGSSLRYLISIASNKFLNNPIPYGTLIVNVTGGLLIGLIMEASISTNLIPSNLRLFLTTGILGGLTTFSTFSYETMSMFINGSYTLALINTFSNLLFSFLGVWIGRFIIQFII